MVQYYIIIILFSPVEGKGTELQKHFCMLSALNRKGDRMQWLTLIFNKLLTRYLNLFLEF